MKVEPSQDDWAFARAVHEEFSRKPGSRLIASEFALAHLGALVNATKPSSVLEFGAGIGTVTCFLLRHPARVAHVTTTESHPFCLEQLRANVPAELSGRYDLVVDEGTLPPGRRHYDLVIVDASVGPRGCGFLEAGVACFVEGTRSAQRREIRRALAARGLRCDFVNYNRGTRYLRLVFRRWRRGGIRWPRLRFRKRHKGCWIGVVEPALEGPAAAARWELR